MLSNENVKVNSNLNNVGANVNTEYTITRNNDFNSVEIQFTGKPSEAVRDALKALRFRWHSVKKVWYGYATEDAAREAIVNAEQTKAEQPETRRADKAAAVDREMLRAEFAKVWNEQRMIDYCTNKVAAVATLPDGTIITVDKQSIETRFCFGESGYDYDDAVSMAQHARTSQEYFKSENMKVFKRALNDLKEALNGVNNYKVVIYPKTYIDQDNGCKLGYYRLERITDIIDACGGSCYMRELPGKEIKIRDFSGHVATPKEIEIIIDAYEAAAAVHEKKINSYLKRYGTSKVYSWTYWRDA